MYVFLISKFFPFPPGGMMSVFLMGVYDEETKRWLTVTKCGNGHDDKTLDRLQTELDMVKINKVMVRIIELKVRFMKPMFGINKPIIRINEVMVKINEVMVIFQ